MSPTIRLCIRNRTRTDQIHSGIKRKPRDNGDGVQLRCNDGIDVGNENVCLWETECLNTLKIIWTNDASLKVTYGILFDSQITLSHEMTWRETSHASEEELYPDCACSATTQFITMNERSAHPGGNRKRLAQTRLDELWGVEVSDVWNQHLGRRRITPQPGVTFSRRRDRQLTLDSLWTNSAVARTQTVTSSSSEELAQSPPSNWPWEDVEFIADFKNPAGLQFDVVPPFQVCECDSPCRWPSCVNAQSNIFCSSNCCKFAGRCGNGLESRSPLKLVQDDSTFGIGVIAPIAIDTGVIIGEYFGELKILTPEEVVQNEGYLVQMKASPHRYRTSTVYIDARRCGNVTRFFNHSCNASTTFQELCNGSKHTVVVVTSRHIRAGEQITVDYKGRLWFDCKCGAVACRRPAQQ